MCTEVVFRAAVVLLPDAMSRLSVIIVSVNVRSWLERCLRSLEQQDVFGDVEVVVVDNGSSDGSGDMVKWTFPNCKLVHLGETVGFGEANNIGVQHSRAPILLFLNPDTVVCAGSLNVMLIRLEEQSQCAVAGGKILDGEGKLERSVGSFPSFFNMVLGRALEYVTPARRILGRFSHQHWVGYNKPHGVDWVTGAYLWIRRDVFEQIGGFDKCIFMYCDDVDLCYRVHQLGFKCQFFPDAPIIHYGGRSPTPRPRKELFFESLLYFANKHYKSPRFWTTRFMFWVISKLQVHI